MKQSLAWFRRRCPTVTQMFRQDPLFFLVAVWFAAFGLIVGTQILITALAG